MVARLVGIVDDVGRVVRKLFFLAEIAVMNDGVDMADGAIESNLVKVIIAAGVVEIELAAVFQWLWQCVVGVTLLREVLEHVTFINIVVGIKVKLLVLEADFVINFQSVVVAV